MTLIEKTFDVPAMPKSRSERIVVVLRDQPERAVDADAEHEPVGQPVGGIEGGHDGVLGDVALALRARRNRERKRRHGQRSGPSTSTSELGKMPDTTPSTSKTATPASVAGFQNIEERLPPAAMPAKDVPCP